jgi:hypothetical protein
MDPNGSRRLLRRGCLNAGISVVPRQTLSDVGSRILSDVRSGVMSDVGSGVLWAGFGTALPDRVEETHT